MDQKNLPGRKVGLLNAYQALPFPPPCLPEILQSLEKLLVGKNLLEWRERGETT